MPSLLYNATRQKSGERSFLFMKGNLVYVQSGGPTSVINSSLYGAILEAKKHPEIEHVFGSLNGVEGLIEDTLIDMYAEDETELSYLKQTPGTILGSARRKLPEDLDDPVYDKIFATLHKHNIKAVLFNGGNDSMDTTNKISRVAAKRGEDILTIGIPKTIDNDLANTDHSVGFPSAARMVMNQTLALSIDSCCFKKGKVYLVEIMGRDAGWLTAAAGLVPAPYTPDAFILPEMKQDVPTLLEIIRKAYEEKGHAVIAMSEGVQFDVGVDVEVDSFGHICLDGAAHGLAKLIKKELRLPVREVIYSTLARANPVYISKVDSEEAMGVGGFGVKAVTEGKTGYMVAIKRDSTVPYASHFELHPVSEIANAVSLIPQDWLEGYTKISEPLKAYILSLINAGIEIKYDENGLTHYTKLRKVKVVD